jgi:6-phosphofructokinase 2
MIYTVTLIPSLDVIVEVEELVYDDMNRIQEERKVPGGRGIDISRVIKELGGQSVALGFIGGYNGFELEGRLVNEGVLCDFTKINGETRSNIVFYQRRKKLQTLLSTSGPEVSSLEVTLFYNKIKDLPRGSHVVICGGMPVGVSESFFAQLVTVLKEKNAKVYLDTDGEALRQGAGVSPFLMKPNIHELGRLVERNLSEIEEVLEAAEPYRETVQYIVVSMGARGVVGIGPEGRYHVTPPKVKVRSSLGAGDSLVAGIVYMFSSGGSFSEALALGVACGTASTLRPGNVLCSKEDIAAVRAEVMVKRI